MKYRAYPHINRANNNNNIIYIYIIILFTCLLDVNNLNAQQNADIQIANEYLIQGEKEKARAVFEELIKDARNIPIVHTNYFNLLIDLEDFKEGEKYLDRLMKRDPGNIQYKFDLGLLYSRSGDVKKSDAYNKELIAQLKTDAYRSKLAAEYYAARQNMGLAVQIFLACREALNSPYIFALEMASIYRALNQRDKMVEEYLNYVVQMPSNLAYVKNLLQNMLSKPEEFESLEEKLLDRAQENPDQDVYPELLIWNYIQQKNFFAAFTQTRALDRRQKKDGEKSLDLAQIALSNGDYDAAERIFSFVDKEFSGTQNQLMAKVGIIRAKELRIKHAFPVRQDSVQSLIRSYENFIAKNPNNYYALEAQRDKALLLAYYLDEKDAAITELDNLIGNNRTSHSLRSKAKLDLGDIYILKSEYWESVLLYAQVDKTNKETPIGYEAKLKNAKLSYYRGDFKLAQEQLDILKQATTRDISNDAIALSLKIKENSAFDTTYADLRKFANIELMLTQNKIEEVLAEILEMKRKYNGDDNNIMQTSSYARMTQSPLLDDLLWMEANIRIKLGEFDRALQLLNLIIENFADDVLADDALFTTAEIYERHKRDKEKAMEIYRDFLTKFPGSVYVAEARKRFRILRGDAVYLEQNPLGDI
ncbi:MAG TPA: tetratricopeptide repeat protein [Cyclobacteriaceae bacterium]|nr:tetratricopeptide repeat protein [Cyclobacteriaceae bacterium]